jgi:preprotein translocase subunit SecY
MPIILRKRMFIPAALAGLSKSDTSQSIVGSNMFGFWYNFILQLLIIVFTFSYTAITVPTNKMSDDLREAGGFIPGIRPGLKLLIILIK